ncbi:hypothetical protein HBB16_00790, partial [Pseudonocardia sp. MCCB 268]|nr:hypothetical protein [Pseudonocardia cytotoxica]
LYFVQLRIAKVKQTTTSRINKHLSAGRERAAAQCSSRHGSAGLDRAAQLTSLVLLDEINAVQSAFTGPRRGWVVGGAVPRRRPPPRGLRRHGRADARALHARAGRRWPTRARERLAAAQERIARRRSGEGRGYRPCGPARPSSGGAPNRSGGSAARRPRGRAGSRPRLARGDHAGRFGARPRNGGTCPDRPGRVRCRTRRASRCRRRASTAGTCPAGRTR